jgi:uncharacterized protein YndB with AHSA1/START domain
MNGPPPNQRVPPGSHMVNRYHLATDIGLSADPEQVWEALARSDTSASWWRWLREVEVIHEGDERGVGARFRHQVGTPLLYGVSYEGEVTRVVEPFLAEFEASGDFVGTGQFRLRPTEDGGTDLTFTWLVATPKRWMSLLGRVARPVLIWNHHRLMSDFAEDLADTTEAEVLDVRHRVVRSGDRGFYRLPGGGE